MRERSGHTQTGITWPQREEPALLFQLCLSRRKRLSLKNSLLRTLFICITHNNVCLKNALKLCLKFASICQFLKVYLLFQLLLRQTN